jgi:large subunit ribosomal protein L15
MQLNNLKRNTKLSNSKQVGRGGKRGKTSGRGTKGQKAHGGHGIRPHMRDIIKKLPKLRGHGKNSNPSIQTKPQVLNVKDLEKAFAAGDIVNPVVLAEKKLVRNLKGKGAVVKILADGEVTKKLTVEKCHVSAAAVKKIEAAGGSVVKAEK